MNGSRNPRGVAAQRWTAWWAAVSIGLALPAGAQGGAAAKAAPSPAALGRALFTDVGLSSSGKTSCSTCHDEQKSFTDGRGDARGQLDIGIGRNSPTMFAIGQVARFRDPRQAELAAPGHKPRVLTLEERCLAPLENELEMAAGVPAIVKKLAAREGMREQFDRVFGGSGTGVTKERLAQAFAAYLRTLDPPATPYGEFLQGKETALDATEQRGRAVFAGVGRCASCHAGPALTDGLMHVVDPPHGQRIQDRVRAATDRRIALLKREYAAKKPGSVTINLAAMADEARARRDLPGGGGYDPAQLEVQTTTLWDVARTAPYFRDGSAATLSDAVVQHVTEIRTVAARPDEVKKALLELDQAGKRSPVELRAARDATVPRAVPGEITGGDLADLVAFLQTFSPRGR